MTWAAHDVCEACWPAFRGDAVPVRLAYPHHETCCRCGVLTDSGILIRAETDTLRHCSGHGRHVSAGRGAET